MPDLNEALIFARVVEAGSFTRAARQLGVPTSTVSRRVARLEERLALRLLQRTTRALSLTDAGRTYYESATRALRDLETAESALARMNATPSGKLRVTAPADMSTRIWTLVSQYLRHYPNVDLELDLTSRVVDLVEEGFDLALRGGQRPDSGAHVIRKLVDSPMVLVASPHYLERHEPPQQPKDLMQHECVVFRPLAPNGKWPFREGRQEVQIPVRGRLVLDDLDLVKQAVLEGFGIAMLFDDVCRTELEAGQLVQIAAGTCLPRGALWLLYPSRRHLLPATRAFIDHATAHFAGLPAAGV